MGPIEFSEVKLSPDNMRRGEFPKIKKNASAKEDVGGVEQALHSRPEASRWVLKILVVSIILLFAQFFLFVKTYLMYQEIKRNMAANGLVGISASVRQMQPESSVHLPSKLRFVSKTHKESTIDKQVISDFTRKELLTNLNTRIYPSRVGESASILKLTLDNQNRSDSSDGSLAISFNFLDRTSKFSEINIDLPLIDIAKYNMLSFRLMGDEKQQSKLSTQRLIIKIVPAIGSAVEYEASDLSSSWKQYEINLWQGRESPREFLIKKILFVVLRDNEEPRGLWHLDDIVLERVS